MNVLALPQERTSDTVCRVTWQQHHAEMVQDWTLEDTPHVSIISPTGNGKTVLITQGLMPALRDEQVIFFDVKGWDGEINGVQMRRIKRFPTRVERNFRNKEPMSHWYLYRATDNVETARIISRAYQEGSFTLIFDEERAITDRHPSLGLGSLVEMTRLRGRGRVSVIGSTQAPRFVASSFYEQASHMYIGRIEDRRARKRLQEIGGNTDVIEGIVSRLGRYEFLYIGPLDESGSRVMEVTKVPYG